DRRAEALRRLGEGERRRVRIGESRLGLPRGAADVVGATSGQEVSQSIRGDRLRRDAEALLAGDVAGERCLVARRDDLDEADRLEAAVAADDIPEVAEDLAAFEREPGFRFICIVHAYQRPRLSSSGGAQVAPLEQQDAPNSSSRQGKNGTR